jgi:hypothetical protein
MPGVPDAGAAFRSKGKTEGCLREKIYIKGKRFHMVGLSMDDAPV